MKGTVKVLVCLLLLLVGLPVFASGNKEEAAPAAPAEQEVDSRLVPVAEALGIDINDLANALGDLSQGKPDFDAVAGILGVDATELENEMDKVMEGNVVELEPYTITLNGFDFTITDQVFTWDELPEDLVMERSEIMEFTNEDGVTHYYERIYLPDGNLNWYQAAYLAQDAGGYMACPESDAENTFLFELVNDMKYFWAFDEDGGHYGISIGPFLGGFQPEGSAEPAGGWTWLSGASFDTYSNWAQNLDDGVTDKDPRDNTQPNDSGDGQPIMGFGELNIPVATWGDYMESIGTYGKTKLPGRSYAFFIEYESKPE